MADAKLEKQKAFLLEHLSPVMITKEVAIPMFKYFGVDVSEYEKELEEYRQILDLDVNGGKMPSKEDLKKAINGTEELTSYLMYLWVEELIMNIEKHQVTNPEYEKDFLIVDKARQQYLEKWQKAFNRKKKGGPGFDGVKTVK